MYVAVKGGETAIAASLDLLAAARRGSESEREIQVAQIREQLGLLVDRVMAEGSLYDPELAALALKQARGDAIEATFLLRAYRSTLPRLGYSEPLDTGKMEVRRRISAIFKDLPGGQVLGPTYDYTQRLLDFNLLHKTDNKPATMPSGEWTWEHPDGTRDDTLPPALKALDAQGLIEQDVPSEGDPEPNDITRKPPAYPMNRATRMQMLSRADEGWVLGMGYSSQRGYANSHPFAGEIRVGKTPLTLVPDELGFPIEIGEVELTECQMVTQFGGSAKALPQFTRGYGLVFGEGERKAMAMSIVDRVLRADEFGEDIVSPAQQQEFMLPHGDNVEASGFVQHLKLPHYVDFETEMQMVRALRESFAKRQEQEQGHE